MQNFFSLEPDKETPEQKAWNDMNMKVNTIATYCYTISDQIIEKQQKCEKNTPYQVARDFDNFVDNMCKQKVQKELAQIGKDLGMKAPRIEDSQVLKAMSRSASQAPVTMSVGRRRFARVAGNLIC